MTGLIITGSILLLLAVLLFSPVALRFAYSGGKRHTSVRYLLITVDLSPEKLAKRADKRAKREVKKEYKKQKAEEGAEDTKKEAAKDTVETVWSLVKASKKGLDILRKHLVFYRIRASVAAGGGDAHQTAMNYAKLCTLIASGLAVLDSLFVVKEPEISISPDFTREETGWDIAFRVRIAPWYVLSAGMYVLIRFLKVIRGNKAKREKIKGGKRHEPTACY